MQTLMGSRHKQLAGLTLGYKVRVKEDYSRFDTNRNETVTRVSSRGVMLIRRVDGVDFAGIGQYGGVKIVKPSGIPDCRVTS